MKPRIALFTLEGAASAEAALRFAEAQSDRIALVGWSSPFRATRALGRALRRGGPGLLPYLFVNHALPALLGRPGLAALCRAHGIPVLRLGDEAATIRALRDSGAELLVSFHLDRILSPAILAVPRLGGINVHPSLLPRHRGPIPAFHGLAEGRTGISVHALTPEVDAGGVWAQREVALPPSLSASAAARELHLAALPLLEEAIARIAAGEAPPEPPPRLPYAPWPDRTTRRRAGVPLLRLSDIGAAWRAPAGGWR
ncbi:formyltransferase family protein [Sabulicella rubraurantiaca]|uniref:formyltransferase family protein n=1 Tax=Sabulicella rubraurantiaca TaxID=2811429 RepID=UPI001A96EDB6|nr:formyltransferase family protein [Sabulicella rubraurantiaca]